MSITLSSIRTAVLTVLPSFSRSRPPSLVTCCLRLTEPRLHTAISSFDVLSVISVHRFDECTTPACCCGLLKLHASLKVIHGWPVSNNIDNIFRHRSFAWTRLKWLISPLWVMDSYSL